MFHIYAVDTVDDGIEILTGVPAGIPDKNGKYPKGTVNYMVAKNLDEYYKHYVKYARETEGCLGKWYNKKYFVIFLLHLLDRF